MQSHTTALHRLIALCRLLSAGLGLILLGCWALGLWRYTSFGIDLDRPDAAAIQTSYYRIRWPGDGSLWLGGGTFSQPSTAHAVEQFDLGGVFLLPPRPAQPHSHWNRLGFWSVSVEDALAGTSERWLGVPGWLPALLVSVPGLAATARRRHQRGGAAPPDM